MTSYALTDFEWSVIQPLLPNKPHGVPRVDDRRVLNGIFWVLRTGTPWPALPSDFDPYTTCYNRFVRWRKAGVFDRIMSAITEAYEGNVQMIDSTTVRVNQHAASKLLGRLGTARSFWPTKPMMGIGSARLLSRAEALRTFPLGQTGIGNHASRKCSTNSATASSVSSTRSNTFAMWLRDMRNTPPTTWQCSSWRHLPSG